MRATSISVVVARRAALLLAAALIVAPVLLGVRHALSGGGPVAVAPPLPGFPPPMLDSASFPWVRYVASVVTALGAGLLALVFGWPMARVLAWPSGRAGGVSPRSLIPGPAFKAVVRWFRNQTPGAYTPGSPGTGIPGQAPNGALLRGLLVGLSITLLVVPPFVLARGLAALVALLGFPTLFVPVFQAGGTADPIAGAIGVIVVGALNGFPIAGALLGLALRSRRASERELIALLPVVPGGEWRRRAAVWRIEVARIAPFALIAMAVVALRIFLDDATPSLLGQRSFSREIQIACDSEGGVGPTVLQFALAALAVTLPLIGLAIAMGRRAHIVDAARADDSTTTAGAAPRAAFVAWFVLLLLGLAVPLAALAASPHADIPWRKIATERYDALYGSAWLCTNTALLASAFGVLLAALHRAERSPAVRVVVWFALALAVAWPPHPAAFGLLGIDVPRGWSHGALRTFDLSRLLFALSTRYALVAFLAAGLALRRVAPSARDVALTSGLPWHVRWRVLHMWPTLRAACFAGTAVGLLALVERESAEVLFVPGFDTITACIYRLLHTGTDSRVIGLVLITTAMVAVVTTLASWIVWLVSPRRGPRA